MSERLLRWFTLGQIADVHMCTGQPPNILFRNADFRKPNRMTEGTDKSANPIRRCAQMRPSSAANNARNEFAHSMSAGSPRRWPRKEEVATPDGKALVVPVP